MRYHRWLSCSSSQFQPAYIVHLLEQPSPSSKQVDTHAVAAYFLVLAIIFNLIATNSRDIRSIENIVIPHFDDCVQLYSVSPGKILEHSVNPVRGSTYYPPAIHNVQVFCFMINGDEQAVQSVCIASLPFKHTESQVKPNFRADWK